MKKRRFMGILALAMCWLGSPVRAVTPDASSGATVVMSDHNSVVWNAENKVPIFSNSVFYPGYQDDYWFTVKNTNDHTIEYQMAFELKDNSAVPLDIKVSRGSELVFDHRTPNGVTEETVESEVLKLPAGATYTYHFQLLWDDVTLTDVEDTAHGVEAMTKDKTTSVNFWFEMPDDLGKKPNNNKSEGSTKPLIQYLPKTFGKFGEKSQVLSGVLGGIIIVGIAILGRKRRKADDGN